MANRILRNPYTVIILALLLIGAGSLAMIYGLGFFHPSPLSPSVTPLGAIPGERLIPTPTVRQVRAPTQVPSVPGFATAALSPTTSPVAQTAPTTSIAAQQPASPTSTQTPAIMLTVVHTPAPSTKPQVGVTPQSGQSSVQLPGQFSPQRRIGFVAPLSDVDRYDVSQLGAGWYIWCPREEGAKPVSGMDCAHLVAVSGTHYLPDAIGLRDLARRDPGRLWLVGNEPDVVWQGNATPQEYAQVYHEVYQILKGADPTSKVAIGGISQVTPLRLRYLEQVLAVYEEAYGQPMLVDVWNIHLAILREERGTWGVDIPPGLPDDAGVLYEIQDNADIEIFKEQVSTFRRWMAEQGERNKPLIVSEFSVLMPPDYGFPFERVRDFMFATLDFLMTASDEHLGYPADGNRLVQRWAWYSLADRDYYTGNLFDPETGLITPLGRAFAAYCAGW